MSTPPTPADVRFAADSMLQSLAIWLRLLGYDCLTTAEAHASATETSCSGGVSLRSRALLERAVAEGRVFLTRNTHLPANLPTVLLRQAEIIVVAGEHLPEQLREVTGKFALDTARFVFTRCVECNEVLRRIEREEATGLVPSDVLAREQEFWCCGRCGRAYWRGSHVAGSLARLQKWLAFDRADAENPAAS